jgi:excisionase family DNA binding protein
MQSPRAIGETAVERWRDRQRSRTAASESSSVSRQLKAANERPRTVKEAASELGLSVHTIRAWVAARRIAHVRLGRAVRIPAAAIRQLLDDNTVPAIDER